MTKKVSLKDIAQALDLSTTTVSFVLNNQSTQKRISPAVEKKVKAMAELMQYTPNLLAKSLRTGVTKTIGLIVEDIANYFFSNIAKIIEEKALQKGYKVFYSSTNGSPQKAKELIFLLRERKVDGFIITPTAGIEEDITQLQKMNIPLVLIDRYYPAITTNYVVSNNYKGAYDATMHLIAKGHKKIFLVTLASTQVQMQDRLQGYTNALAQHNIILSKRMILYINFNTAPKDAVAAIQQLLTYKPDAILFTTNYLGIYGLEAIKMNHLIIPQHVSVVCYDEHDLFRLYQPGITTVVQPITHIANAAVQYLIQAMEKNTETIHQKVFDCSIKKRNSVAQIK